jgi:hypothetical protein
MSLRAFRLGCAPAIKRDKQNLYTTAILLNLSSGSILTFVKELEDCNNELEWQHIPYICHHDYGVCICKTRETSDNSEPAWDVLVCTISLYCNSSPLRHHGKQDTFQCVLLKHTNGICSNKWCCEVIGFIMADSSQRGCSDCWCRNLFEGMVSMHVKDDNYKITLKNNTSIAGKVAFWTECQWVACSRYENIYKFTGLD